MIKFENVKVAGFEESVRGMRNPMNSWDKSDSLDTPYGYMVGPEDKRLMMNLAEAGTSHSKYRRMIIVWVDIIAPLYWWKEFDTYKVGTVANSCSTMHKIHAKEFTLEDFSREYIQNFHGYRYVLNEDDMEDYIGDDGDNGHSAALFETALRNLISELNVARKLYLRTGHKLFWWQMIQLLPSSYNQKRTVMMSYEVLANIYATRRGHKLDEWANFCRWIEGLPEYEIITAEVRVTKDE